MQPFSINEPVLVLNANFEPLNVCATRRAIGLMFSGKAELVINGRGYVKTVSRKIPRPSVIRLGYMIKRPRPRVRLSKREIFRRDRHTCQYCGGKTGRLTVDHVVPRHRGGLYSWTNLVAACPGCNLKKGGRLPEEARMRLNRTPNEPKASAMYLFGTHLTKNKDWEPFLDGW